MKIGDCVMNIIQILYTRERRMLYTMEASLWSSVANILESSSSVAHTEILILYKSTLWQVYSWKGESLIQIPLTMSRVFFLLRNKQLFVPYFTQSVYTGKIDSSVFRYFALHFRLCWSLYNTLESLFSMFFFYFFSEVIMVCKTTHLN